MHRVRGKEGGSFVWTGLRSRRERKFRVLTEGAEKRPRWRSGDACSEGVTGLSKAWGRL